MGNTTRRWARGKCVRYGRRAHLPTRCATASAFQTGTWRRANTRRAPRLSLVHCAQQLSKTQAPEVIIRYETFAAHAACARTAAGGCGRGWGPRRQPWIGYFAGSVRRLLGPHPHATSTPIARQSLAPLHPPFRARDGRAADGAMRGTLRVPGHRRAERRARKRYICKSRMHALCGYAVRDAEGEETKG
jgi:hypothetical protein